MLKIISRTEVLFKILHPFVRTDGVNISLLACFYRLRRLDSSYQNVKTFPWEDEIIGVKHKRNLNSLEKESREAVLLQELGDKYACTSKEISSMIERYPNLLKVSTYTIRNNIDYVKNMGLSKSMLIECPWVLMFTQKTKLSDLMNYALKIHSDINVAIPLVQISPAKLKELCCITEDEAGAIPKGNKINYLSKRLECKPAKISQIAVNHPFILSLPFDRMETILNLLTDAKVSPQAVLKDIWVFRYSISGIEDRLHRAKEAGIQKIKPWVVRCPESTFQRTIQRHVSSRELLGSHPTIVSYLCQRLDCSQEMLEYITTKAPQMPRVNVRKLKEILDFLYEEGFTPQQVCQVPRVVSYSLETLQARLAELRDLGYNPNSLIVLCKTKREFKEFIEKLVSVKEKRCAKF